MDDERREQIADLRARCEELRIEFAHYRHLYRTGEMTADEIAPVYRAIARDMREVAAELRALMSAYLVAIRSTGRFS
jgi:hypothetical protein